MFGPSRDMNILPIEAKSDQKQWRFRLRQAK